MKAATRRSAIVAAILTMLAAAPGVRAQTPDADEMPSAKRLREVYRERCRREVESLSTALDRLDAEVLAKIPAEADATLGEAVAFAWSRGARARSLFAALRECPRRYTRWAREAGLPDGFAIGDEVLVANSRREAIRPLLLPVIDDPARSGWADPEGDAATWKGRPSSRVYEFLMLLRWAAHGAGDVARIDRDWFVHQVEIAAPASEADDGRSLLHGEYRFAPSGEPLPGDARPRARAALAVLRAPGRIGTKGRGFRHALDAREALLLALLKQAAEDGGALESRWLAISGRQFPPFTALRTDFDDASGTLSAMRGRPGSPVRRAFEALERSGDPESVRLVREAIFWYQARRIGADGRIEPPFVGWTTDVPGPTPREASSRDGGAIAAPRAGANPPPDPDADVPPESAWRRIGEWVARRIMSGPGRSAGRLRVVIDNRTPWRLAFGREELAEILAELGVGGGKIEVVEGPDAGAAASVVVTRARPGDRIDVELHRPGRAPEHRTFRVPGAWPPWFATPAGWDRRSWAFALVAAMAVALVLARAWRDSEPGSARERIARPDILLTGLALGAAFLPLAFDAPIPAASARRGGKVVFVVPTGPEMPPEMKDFVASVCAEACRALSARSVAPAASPGGARSRRVDGPGAESRVDLRYEVRCYYWADGSARVQPLGQGRVADATQGSIRAGLDRDLPAGAERTLPPSLSGSPEPGAVMAVILHDGDHGALTPHDGPAARPERPVLSVWLPTPSRDARAARRLDARSRHDRVRRASTLALSPLRGVEGADGALGTMADGIGLDGLDDAARSPGDLEAQRAAVWRFGPSERQALSGLARRAGGRAAEMYRGAPPATSRTALRWAPAGSAPPKVLAIAAALVAFLWLRGRGIAARTGREARAEVARALARSVVPLALACAGLVALEVAWSSEAWAFGRPVREGFRQALFALVAACVLAPLLGYAAWALERRRPSEYVRAGDAAFFPIGPAREARRPRAALRGAGLLAAGAALALWIAGPTRASGRPGWPFLPTSDMAGRWAAVGLWALGIAAIGPRPRAGGDGP